MKRKDSQKTWMLSLICVFWFISSGVNAGTFDFPNSPKTKKEILTADGPYLLYQPDGSVRLIRVDKHGNLTDSIARQLAKDFTFQVTDHKGDFAFNVQLHPVNRPACRYEAPEKTFVLSDPHGKLDCLISILQGNGIIDKQLHWNYGTNHLMVIGDVFDRGKDVISILWLLYQLENEAQKAGGNVSFLLGNHEPMVLGNDLRYAKAKYLHLAEKLNMEYHELLGTNTELGRWLSTRNTVQIIGNDFYVHAGLSQEFYNLQLQLEEVNETMSRVIFLPTKDRNNHDKLSAFLYGSRGPIWYRGLVRTDEKYSPVQKDSLQLILDHYQVKHIIVGHTIFKEPRTFYEGKVIGVNVDNKENKKKKMGRALLITKGKYYMAGDKGIIKEL